jgi:hypothetical protein
VTSDKKRQGPIEKVPSGLPIGDWPDRPHFPASVIGGAG